jgi:hypothetical protein
MKFKKISYFFCSVVVISQFFFFNQAQANTCITAVSDTQMCIRLHNNSTETLRIQNIAIGNSLAITTPMPLAPGGKGMVQEVKAYKLNHGGYIVLIGASGHSCVIYYHKNNRYNWQFLTQSYYPENASLNCKVTAGHQNQFSDVDIFDKEL